MAPEVIDALLRLPRSLLMSIVLSALRHSGFALAAFPIPGDVFWPYFFGAGILIVGLAKTVKNDVRTSPGLEKLVLFGPLAFAVAMAIFGGDHLVAARFIAMGIPSWIPGHLFWAYFVGIALITAGLSLATRIRPRLAALMLGIMIFLFVLILHIPEIFSLPHDKTRLTIALRDMALSASAVAFGISQSEGGHAGSANGWLRVLRFQSWGPTLCTITRLLFAITIAVFGIDQVLHPTFAPGIPQENSAYFATMPAWIPGHIFWAYLSGFIFVACALGIASPRHARSGAKILGASILVLALFVYLPLTIANASNIANGLNYLAIHLALAGAALLFASVLPAG
jgi:uncharacterized membrane protein YphA (DoxX/SURF4 family)